MKPKHGWRLAFAPFKASAVFALIFFATPLRAQDKTTEKTTEKVTEKTTEKTTETYLVKNLENLSQIALRLYGKESAWEEIAEANHISAPYLLHEGQKLLLKRAPTISSERGSAAILAFWRRRFGLTGEAQVHSSATTAPKQAAATPATTAVAATTPTPRTMAATPAETTPPSIAKAEVLTKFIAEREEQQRKTETSEIRSARGNFELGKEKFSQKDYKSACPLLHESRTQDSKQIAYWLYELRCLKESHASSNEVSTVAKDFKEAHPAMSDLPFLKTLEQESAQSPNPRATESDSNNSEKK